MIFMSVLGIIVIAMAWKFKGFWFAVFVALGWVLLQLLVINPLVAIYR